MSPCTLPVILSNRFRQADSACVQVPKLHPSLDLWFQYATAYRAATDRLAVVGTSICVVSVLLLQRNISYGSYSVSVPIGWPSLLNGYCIPCDDILFPGVSRTYVTYPNGTRNCDGRKNGSESCGSYDTMNASLSTASPGQRRDILA